VGFSHILCLENSIFVRILYCYYIVCSGCPRHILLYNMIFFYQVEAPWVRMGSVRTLYSDNGLRSMPNMTFIISSPTKRISSSV